MFPINDFNGICDNEAHSENQHVIMFLLVKPGDTNANEFLTKLNYWHHRSGVFCNIYLIGYSQGFNNIYKDVMEIDGIDGEKLQYSDSCFCTVIDQMDSRLKNYYYSGEPELIILQNRINTYGRNTLDFSYYNHIEINYGIEKKYIDSFPRFMENLIRASRFDVDSVYAISRMQTKKISPKKIVEFALENDTKLPEPIKRIMGDRLFYKSSHAE